jgi:hypothetical protein
MTGHRPRRIALFCIMTLILLDACAGGRRVASADGEEIKQLDAATVPASLEGLVSRHEDVRAGLNEVRRSYVQSAGLWSLRREDDQVQATLQIIRFFDQPRYESSTFRQIIVNQISSTRPKGTNMGGRTVYRTAGSDQTTALWFRDLNMFLLSIRNDYPKRRSLIRQALEIEP